jgi:hypothetical protein
MMEIWTRDNYNFSVPGFSLLVSGFTSNQQQATIRL